MKKKLSLLISLLFLSTFLFSKTIKVGYYQDSGNFMSGFSPSDPKAGYSYEYMQTIAAYTGWNFEYVYGQWDDLYNALLNGEIDILSDVSYTPEREDLMLFPQYEMGQESYYLYSAKHLNITPGDYESWEDLTIGIRNDCYHYDLFQEWAKDKNLKCKIREFTTADPYTAMLNNGEIDLLLEIDMVADSKWNPIVKIGSSNFYLAVNKRRPDILSDLNLALAEIFAMNPYYNNNLWLKYFSSTTISKELSAREADWLDLNSVIKIGCLYNDLPFSDYNEESKSAEGLLIEMINFLQGQFANENISLDYVLYDDHDQMFNDMKAGKLHAIAPVFRDLEVAENSGLILSEKFSTVVMGYVFKDIPFGPESKKIGIPDNLRIPYFIKSSYPYLETVEYSSYEECMEAVLTNKVDGAIFNIYKIRGLINKNRKYKKLKAIELTNHCDMAFMMTKNNTAFMSLVNKMLMSMPEENKRAVTEYFAVKEQGYTRKTFMQQYLIYLILAFILFVIILFLLIIALKKIKEDIEYDTLTHLLNRKKLDKVINHAMKSADEKNKEFCILLFDLDNFKNINDTYGHAFGDKVLIALANQIRNGKGEKDIAFRWGGEEFLIICRSNSAASYNLAEKIRKSIENVKLQAENNIVSVTVTIGLATYHKGDTYKKLFREADENLYIGKNNGKNQVVMTLAKSEH
ncbi:MAG: diguanylate cyclase [Treponema sp.]|nr:diguanylate cyclase [Treponema sp.]